VLRCCSTLLAFLHKSEFSDTVIRTCVILHNLIIDYEREHNEDAGYINDEMYIPQHPFIVVPRDIHQNGIAREHMVAAMKNNELHARLQHDLMVQRWANWYGAEDDAMDDAAGEPIGMDGVDDQVE
jgi:hypothetical protein